MNDNMAIRIALTKGRLEKDTVGLFEKMGFDVTELRDKGRRLILNIPGQNIEVVLAKAADVVLKQHVNRETDKYNMQGTTSSTALCMIFHAVQAALVEETDYKKEQFALVHPGGAVGERLNDKSL